MKIMTILYYYSSGSYQQDVGANGPMSQQSVSKCLREVTFALNNANVVNNHIKFPQNHQERNIIKRGFYEKYGIAGICGYIDCTICDDNNKILIVDARYEGATHDSFIWSQSSIKNHFEELARTGEQALLLGDSGYPLREYMMVPIPSPVSRAEAQYNTVQKSQEMQRQPPVVIPAPVPAIEGGRRMQDESFSYLNRNKKNIYNLYHHSD